MNKLNSLFLLLSIFLLTSLDAQVVKYAHAFSNDINGMMQFHNISVDDSGYMYRTGNIKGQADFDFGSGEHIVQAKGTNDVFIAKYASNGDLIWVRTLSANQFTNFNFSKAIPNGDLIVAGYFYDSIQLDLGDPGSKVVSEGYEDVFVMKLNAWDGSFKWIKRIGNYAQNYAYGFDVNKEGEIIVSGRYAYDVDVDPGPGQKILSANEKNNTFVVRLDKDGLFKWERHFGGNGHTHIYGIKFDVDGNIVASGSMVGAMSLFSNDPTDTIDTRGVTKAVLVKFNANGNRIWYNMLDGQIYSEWYNMDINSKGQIAVSGYFREKIWFGQDDTSTSNGMYDIVVSKFDSSGQMLWHRSFGGTSYDNTYNLRFDPLDNVYVVGSFNSDMDIDPGPKEKLLSINTTWDGFMLKLDYLGNYRGSIIISSAKTDGVTLLASNADNMYFAASYFDSASLNLTGGNYKLPGTVGSNHNVVVKMSATGLNLNAIQTEAFGSVYPNPANQTCMVNVSGIQTVELLDMQGRPMAVEIQFQGEDHAILNWAGLSNGIYFIQCIDKFGRTFCQRLLIQ